MYIFLLFNATFNITCLKLYSHINSLFISQNSIKCSLIITSKHAKTNH